jgi:lipopolysaccharide transport system ATP-binding protein
LSRITSPTTGEVRLNGRVASLLEVGTGFHPELTGRENIYLNGAILGMTRREIRGKFEEIVSFAEVEKFIDTPVKRYSSGMYVRLAFAVAAHLEPEILVVDEVLAVGDLAFQKKCLNKMEDVSGEGRTVLFVSHNMASIKRLCRSAMVLQEGCLRLVSEAHQAVTEYYKNQQSSQRRAIFLPSQHRVETEFQISSLRMLNSRGEPTHMFHADEPVLLRMDLSVSRPCPATRVGVALHREGVLISNMHTESTDFGGTETGQFVTCEIPARILLPGFYDIHVGAHSAETDRGLDYIPDASSFRVMDVRSGASDHMNARESGLIRITPKWHIDVLDHEEST